MIVQPSFGAALESMTQFFARLTANPPAPLPLPLATPVAALTDPHAAATGQPDQATAPEGPSASQPTLKAAWAGPNGSVGASSVKSEPLTQRQQWQAALSARASAAASSRLGQVANSPAMSGQPPAMAPPPARLSGTHGPDRKQSVVGTDAPAAPAHGNAPVVAPCQQQQQCTVMSCNSSLNPVASAAQPAAYPHAQGQAQQLRPSNLSNPDSVLPQQSVPHQVPQVPSAGVHHTQQDYAMQHQLPPSHPSSVESQHSQQPLPQQVIQASAGVYLQQDSAMQHQLSAVAPHQTAMHHRQHPAACLAHAQLAQHVQYASPLPNMGGQDHMSSVTPASRLRPALGPAAQVQTDHGTIHAAQGQHAQPRQHAQLGQHAQHDWQGQTQQSQNAQHNMISASGVSPAQVLEWVRQDLNDFTTWVSNHEIMQATYVSQIKCKCELLLMPNVMWVHSYTQLLPLCCK